MIVFVTATDTDRLTLEQARRLLPPEMPPVHDASVGSLDDAAIAELAPQIVLVRAFGDPKQVLLANAPVIAHIRRANVPLVVLPSDPAQSDVLTLSTAPTEVVDACLRYITMGGATNAANLLRMLADFACGTQVGFSPPVAVPDAGYYHPDAVDRDACAALDLAGFRAAHWHQSGPAIGLVFYRAYWLCDNLAPVDALIRALERRGCNVLPVFLHGIHTANIAHVFATYLAPGGTPAIDVLISALGFAFADLRFDERTTSGQGKRLETLRALDVPVIQAVSTTLTIDAWRTSERGITPGDATMNVVMPEFDGRIASAPYAFREPKTDGARRLTIVDDRTEAIAALAYRHARLRAIPNGDKRLAIVLNNVANSNARIGAAVGLDTPESLLTILRALRGRGYTIGEIPSDGDRLMEQIIAAGAYDKEMLTEQQMAAGTATFDAQTYDEWFAQFPARSRDELVAAWGEPPGTVYRFGDRIYAAGVPFGNVLVMIQPPRGFNENEDAIYHAGDLVPPHHYPGTYRWVRDVFRADAVIHLGKHGTLEWLPGKALGLAETCYPDLVLGELPVFYPYIIDDPGEGTQAKRRSHACIIDHLIPPMQQAETYDDLARLQQLLDDRESATAFDPQKVPLIEEAIWETSVSANLHTDFALDERPRDFDEFREQLEGYLHELEDAQIRDGLHYFGRLQDGERLIGLAVALMRHDAPYALGLRRALANDLGLTYDVVREPATLGAPYQADLPEALRRVESRPVRTNGDVVHALEALSHQLVANLVAAAFARERIADSLVAAGLPNDRDTAETLAVLATRVAPALHATTDELTHLLAGLDGRHVPPGPSGPPTRGMADILPTGRNFYSVDPQALPSPFAWTVGKRLGDDLIRAYREEHGTFPESIGLVMWGTANMRTQGDDIAEFLWLLGVRPVWQVGSRRVVDLEAIGLEELGRPRIDVTVRGSGFFRDAFPNLIAMLDRAVNLVADLVEPDDQNFVRRHARALQAELEGRGLAAELARRQARYRVFSTKPGAYGVGIIHAIHQKNWETADDLATIYLNWGGYAYDGGDSYGEPARDLFEARMRATQVAAQNQDNREHDIFDNDDYLQFHGGMVGTIRSLTGAAPTAYIGDSAQPDRARVRDLQDEANRVFRTRVVNPRWLESVRRHGYKGALELAATVEYLFGYDATAGIVHDWMYESVTQAYLIDPVNREFVERSNPAALREMAARLLEAAERGLWEAPKEQTLEQLRDALIAGEGLMEAQGEETLAAT
jgi:cobaltochelatase CobN